MKIYYSRSNEVDDEKIRPLITQFIENLPNNTAVELTEYKRGSTYNPELVSNADIVIVGITADTPNYVGVAKGCYEEMLRAFESNKTVLVIGKHDKGRPFIQTVCETDLSIENQNTWRLGYGKVHIFNENCRVNSGSDGITGFIDNDSDVSRFINRVDPVISKTTTKSQTFVLDVEDDDYLLL